MPLDSSNRLPDRLLCLLGRLATSAAGLDLLVRSASRADVDDRQLTLWRYMGSRAVAESQSLFALIASSLEDASPVGAADDVRSPTDVRLFEERAEQVVARITAVVQTGRSIGVRTNPVLIPTVA